MANYRAIFASCLAICNLLRQSRSADLYGADIENVECSVFTTADFAGNIPVDGEVALFMYRVDINGVQRTLPPRPRYDGVQERRHLPVDIRFLLIPRAGSSQLQQLILGWMMRVLEDNPSLPASILNSGREDTFSADEQLHVIQEALTTEEILRIWDQVPSDFNICVPYCAKVVRIESPQLVQKNGAVLVRDLEFQG